MWRVVDRYDTSYYTGLDVRVVLGNTVLDEVVGLSFEVVENVTPLYGYASYTFDRAVRGTRVVRGQFTINFKRSGYILWQASQVALTGKAPVRAREQVDRALDLLRSGDKSAVRQEIQNQLLARRSPAEVIRALRDAYWGHQEARPASHSLFPDTDRYPLRLVIIYGDPLLKDSRGGVFLQPPMEVTAGIKEVTRADEMYQIEQIVDVQIVSFSKAIDDSGRNLLEQYQFIARDIVFYQGGLDLQ